MTSTNAQRILIVVLCLGMGTVFLVSAPELASTKDPSLDEPKTKYFVSEKRYQFYVRGYKQRIVFDPNSYQAKSGGLLTLVSADLMAIHVLATKAQGQAQKYLDYMHAGYRRALVEELKSTNNSVEALSTSWRERYKGMRIELLRHISTELDAIIWYRVFDPITGKDIEVAGLAFRLGDNANWELVDLSQNVVYRNWDFEGETKIIRQQ